MNNVYDILLNFNKGRAYEFFEWYEDDNIEHIKKIPAFKITDDQMIDIINYTISVNDDFLNKIFNKTEKFNNKKIDIITFSAIIGNGKEALAFKFNKNGDEICRSNLVLDEKEEVLEILKHTTLSTINIKLIKKIKIDLNCTRFERNSRNKIKSEISMIYNNNDYDKLKYIYYELFRTVEKDKLKMYNTLIKEIDTDWGLKHQQLVELFKLFNVKKQL